MRCSVAALAAAGAGLFFPTMTAAAAVAQNVPESLNNAFIVPPNRTAEAPEPLSLLWGETLFVEWRTDWPNITMWFSACNGSSGKTVFVNQPNTNIYPLYLDQAFAVDDGCSSDIFYLEIHEYNTGEPQFRSADFFVDEPDDGEGGGGSGSGEGGGNNVIKATLTETLVPTASDGVPTATLELTAVASVFEASMTQSFPALASFTSVSGAGTSALSPGATTSMGGAAPGSTQSTGNGQSSNNGQNSYGTGSPGPSTYDLGLGLGLGLGIPLVLLGAAALWLFVRNKKAIAQRPASQVPARQGQQAPGAEMQGAAPPSQVPPAAATAVPQQSKAGEPWRGVMYG